MVFLLKIFLSLWPAGNDLSMRLMNARPMLVLTLLLYGGLNHITFLCRSLFQNFENKPTCRLINPSKPEIGRISKQILEEINRKLVDITKVNQWKNTSSVLQWFKQLANKGGSAFICFDVVEFYP